MNLFAELRRRKLFKVGGAYLVVAWVVIQAASIAFPTFDAPVWALRIFILVTLLGFPIALVLAWAIEIGPDGIRLEPAPVGNKRVASIAALLAVLAIAWYFVGRPRAIDADARSVAVLPFVNMSADPAQEYFSDGVAEELLNRLAQSVDLHVAARTSAFQFKGRNLDIADIARQLKVANVLEGSVRKDGSRIRVTAQLIDAASGFHRWSQTFERDASDIFKVQDEIASAITTALEGQLAGHDANRHGAQSIDPAAYDEYLQARRHAALRVGDNLRLAAEAFTRAIARAPEFAPAYSGRAFVLVVGQTWTSWIPVAEALASANADIAQALRLDPDSAEAHMVRAIIENTQLQSSSADVDFERALKLAPGNVDVLNFYGDFLESVGALRRAEALKRQAMALDPFAFILAVNLAMILNDQGRYAEAAVSAERAVALRGNGFAYEALFYARLRTGANDAARAALAEACADYGSEEPQCLLDTAFALAASGSRDEARALVERAAVQPSPLWSGNPPFSMAAAVYSAGLGDYASAAAAVRSSFGVIAWAPTMPLLLAPGGARLPEEISQDRQWLDAWADPRAQQLMAAYRANIAAFRRGE